MFPIHFKLTVSTPEELARITAFITGDYTATVAAAPKLTTIAEAVSKPAELDDIKRARTEAPGKPSAAPTAPSPRTAEVAPALVSAAPAQSTEATPPAAAAPSASQPVAYADLQKAVLTLHKADPTAAVPIAKSLGADTFKQLPDTKWAEALRLVNEAIEQRKAA